MPQHTARDATDDELMVVIENGRELIERYGGVENLNRIDALILAACMVEAGDRGLIAPPTLS